MKTSTSSSSSSASHTYFQVWQYYLLPPEEQRMPGVKNPMCHVFPRIGQYQAVFMNLYLVTSYQLVSIISIKLFKMMIMKMLKMMMMRMMMVACTTTVVQFLQFPYFEAFPTYSYYCRLQTGTKYFDFLYQYLHLKYWSNSM